MPLERRTIHGHFSRELEPVLAIEPGGTVRLRTLDSGWGVEPDPAVVLERRRFDRDPELDTGHPLCGPIEVRGALPGQTLAVRVDALEPGSFGFTDAGGWPSFLNDRLGLADGVTEYMEWRLADGIGRNAQGHAVRLAPFLGVMGMPPDEPGRHSTLPPRPCGGNLDCKELVAGSTLYLPVPVAGALFSAGDGHARQGDGEVAGLAIECPFDRVELTLDLRDDLPLEAPLAETPAGWVALGVHPELDEAAAIAVAGILVVLERELGVARREALALASVVVDLRVTQIVNGTVGVHALLPPDALL